MPSGFSIHKGCGKWDIIINSYFYRFWKNPVLVRVLAIGQIDRYAPENPHEIPIFCFASPKSAEL
jgi:hypothetical protein